MSAVLVLTGIRGPLKGTEYVFSSRTTCILGRAVDCEPRIPDTKKHGFISRHHCLLDINPPDIRVRDLGSLNGTHVNGEMIGQRDQESLVSDPSRTRFPEHDLRDGDEIQIGDSVFKLRVNLARICSACSKEFSEEEVRDSASSFVMCRRCTELGLTPKVEGGEAKQATRCSSCSGPVDSDCTRNRLGDVLCRSCREEPENIFRNALASTEHVELESIGVYEIASKIGTGGMGVVYAASHKESGRRVALKVMLPQIATSRDAVGRFLREIDITKALKHKNIVELLDSGYSNGAFFLCLEHCRGGSVHNLMREVGGKLSIDDALQVTYQILDALAYAHTVKISSSPSEEEEMSSGSVLVHRDIKPKNILLVTPRSVERVKLADFGLSKAFDLAGLSGLTCTGDVGGSPYFVCRQQVINFKYAKQEVDVWATAATLYNMLTGAHPRNFQTSMDPWQVVLETQPIPIRERSESIPGSLAKVIDYALRDQPRIGFQTVPEFRQALVDAM